MINVFFTYEYGLIYGFNKEYTTNNKFHKHSYEHIVIALDKPVRVFTDKELNTQGILIDSNVTHKVDINSSSILLFLVDKTSTTANQLSKLYFKEKKYHILSDNIVNKIKYIWSKYCNHNITLNEANKIIFETLGVSVSLHNITDERIINALKYINDSEGIYENFTDELIEEADLSKSRFCHLFKEQTGLSLTSYLLSQKIHKTYLYRFSGLTLTESAVKAGFNSLSHFSETNKKTFGFTFADFKDEINIIR